MNTKKSICLLLILISGFSISPAKEIPEFVRNYQGTESPIPVDAFLEFLAPIYYTAKNTSLPQENAPYLTRTTSAYQQSLKQLGYSEDQDLIEQFFVSVFILTDSRDLRMGTMRFFQIAGTLSSESVESLNQFIATVDTEKLDDDQLTSIHKTFILDDNEARLSIPDGLKFEIFNAYARQIESGLRHRIGNYVALIEIGTDLLATREAPQGQRDDVKKRLFQLIESTVANDPFDPDEAVALTNAFSASWHANALTTGRYFLDGFNFTIHINERLLEQTSTQFKHRQFALLTLEQYMYRTLRRSSEDYKALTQQLRKRLVSAYGTPELEGYYIGAMALAAQDSGDFYERALQLWDSGHVSDETRYMLLKYFRELPNKELLPRYLLKLQELQTLRMNSPNLFQEHEFYHSMAMTLTANAFILGELEGSLPALSLEERFEQIISQLQNKNIASHTVTD